VLSQRWPRNAPYTWVPWKFSGFPDYAHGYYSQHFHGLLFRSSLWMILQNLMSVALPIPEIIGSTRIIWVVRVPGYVHAPFSQKFLMGFYLDWPCKCTRQIWSRLAILPTAIAGFLALKFPSRGIVANFIPAPAGMIGKTHGFPRYSCGKFPMQVSIT